MENRELVFNNFTVEDKKYLGEVLMTLQKKTGIYLILRWIIFSILLLLPFFSVILRSVSRFLDSPALFLIFIFSAVLNVVFLFVLMIKASLYVNKSASNLQFKVKSILRKEQKIQDFQKQSIEFEKNYLVFFLAVFIGLLMFLSWSTNMIFGNLIYFAETKQYQKTLVEVLVYLLLLEIPLISFATFFSKKIKTSFRLLISQTTLLTKDSTSSKTEKQKAVSAVIKVSSFFSYLTITFISLLLVLMFLSGVFNNTDYVQDSFQTFIRSIFLLISLVILLVKQKKFSFLGQKVLNVFIQ